MLLFSPNNGAIPNNHPVRNGLCLSLQQLLVACEGLGYIFDTDTDAG